MIIILWIILKTWLSNYPIITQLSNIMCTYAFADPSKIHSAINRTSIHTLPLVGDPRITVTHDFEIKTVVICSNVWVTMAKCEASYVSTTN